LFTTNRILDLIERMVRVMVNIDFRITGRAEIVIRTSSAFIPNPRKVVLTSITNNMRM